MYRLLLLLPFLGIGCTYPIMDRIHDDHVKTAVVEDFVTEFISYELAFIMILMLVFGIWIVVLLGGIRTELRERNLLDKARREDEKE